MQLCPQCQHDVDRHNTDAGCLYGWQETSWYLFETETRRGRPEPCFCELPPPQPAGSS